MIRRLDNRRWAEPIQDARRATRRVSVAEAERKSGPRPAFPEELLFSWPKTSAVIGAPPFRVRRIFQSHFEDDL
jgi:hypothetical protein